jgi:hypothetical protein
MTTSLNFLNSFIVIGTPPTTRVRVSRRREGLITSRKTMKTQRVEMSVTIAHVAGKTIRLFVIKARVRHAVFCVNKQIICP